MGGCRASAQIVNAYSRQGVRDGGGLKEDKDGRILARSILSDNVDNASKVNPGVPILYVQ